MNINKLQVVRLTWHDVNGWVAEGGSKLGSKHSVPEERLEKVAAKIKEYNFHGILFVGDYNVSLRKCHSLHLIRYNKRPDR